MGRIVSVMHVRPSELGAGFVPKSDETVLELELAGDDANHSLLEIHSDLAVDIKVRKLISRPADLPAREVKHHAD
jgi:hypothetical protein